MEEERLCGRRMIMEEQGSMEEEQSMEEERSMEEEHAFVLGVLLALEAPTVLIEAPMVLINTHMTQGFLTAASGEMYM